MQNEININSSKKKYIVYFILAAVTFIVYWQVNGFEFINIDDPIYVVENGHVKSGITFGESWPKQRAVDGFSKVITNKPDDINSLNNRGFVCIQIGQYESGCQDAKKSLFIRRLQIA
jgi:hypothetical protein